MEIHDAVASLS